MNINRKQLLFIVIGIMIFGFLVYIILNQRPKSGIKTYSSQILAQNIQYPTKVNDKTIQFFTGSALAELNTESLETKALTKELNLPRATALYWQGSKALIRFDTVTIATANKIAYDTDSDPTAWWVFDASDSSLRPVSSAVTGYTVIDALWSSDGKGITTLLQAADPTDQQIARLNETGSVISNTKTAGQLNLVADTASGLIVQRFDQVLLLQKDKEKFLFTSSKKPRVSNNLLYYTTATKTDGRNRINVFDLSKNKINKEQDYISNSFAVSDAGLLALPVNSNTPSKQFDNNGLFYNSSTRKFVTLTLDEESTTRIGVIESVPLVNVTNHSVEALVINTNHELLKVSDNPAVVKDTGKYPPLFSKVARSFIGQTVVTYDGVTNELSIFSLPEENTQANRQAIIQLIRDDKKDPNQVIKHWLVLDISQSDLGVD